VCESMSACVHIYVHIQMYMYIYVHIHIYTWTPTEVAACELMSSVLRPRVRALAGRGAGICTYVCMCVFVCECVRVCVCVLYACVEECGRGVCVRERKTDRERERERGREGGREGERERVCVVCRCGVCACVYVCV